MRFSTVHRVSSYLMVASAFTALALSGELAGFWIAFTLCAGLASFFFEPTLDPRSARAWRVQLGWNIASLALFCITVWRVFGGESLLIAGSGFLSFLLVNKLWNRRSSKDYLQAYVISFLMLVAATALNTDLVFALCFLAYVVFATWTLTLLHLRREMEDNYLLKHSAAGESERVEVQRILNSRRIVDRRFLIGSSLVSIAIFVSSSLIFFLVPRIGVGMFFQTPRTGMRAGFNDRSVELGSFGTIKQNEQVVMRVEFPSGRPDRPLYFRGIAFSRYQQSPDGKSARWEPAPWTTRMLGGGLVPWPPWAGTLSDQARARLRTRSVVQEIYLEPMIDTSVLFGASASLAIEVPRELENSGIAPSGDGMGNVYLSGRHSGVKYTVYSQPDGPISLDRLDPWRRSLFLELPRSLSPRVLDLARQITRAAPDDRSKVAAIDHYLKENYRYTTDLRRDLRYDPLVDFLFVQKAGHCEYFATAMAILLRAVGVPTRHTAGFYGGEWNSVGNYLRVRQGDAHAWVEVYFDGRWEAFDPTPALAGAPGARRFGDRYRELVDTLELAWFKYVIEYNVAKQLDVLRSLRHWLESVRNLGPALLFSSGVALALALVGWCWRQLRQRDRARPSATQRRAVRALERALEALERRGITPKLADTPAEVAARAHEQQDAGAAPFQELVALYYAARFGGQPIAPQELDRWAARVVTPSLISPEPL